MELRELLSQQVLYDSGDLRATDMRRGSIKVLDEMITLEQQIQKGKFVKVEGA